MRIAALPDIHMRGLKFLDRFADQLRAADLILLPGDLTNGGRGRAEDVIAGVREYNTNILAVTGNWDKPHTLDYLMATDYGIEEQVRVIEGVAFIGIGRSLPGPLGRGNIYTEAEFESACDEILGRLDLAMPSVLICHQPPYDTICDKARFGGHVGSKSVRAFIERTQPMVCFTGHIHEGVGIDHIGVTQVINPGPIWDSKGIVVAELDRGGVGELEIYKNLSQD